MARLRVERRCCCARCGAAPRAQRGCRSAALTFRMAKGSKFSMCPTLCLTNLQGHGTQGMGRRQGRNGGAARWQCTPQQQRRRRSDASRNRSGSASRSNRSSSEPAAAGSTAGGQAPAAAPSTGRCRQAAHAPDEQRPGQPGQHHAASEGGAQPLAQALPLLVAALLAVPRLDTLRGGRVSAREGSGWCSRAPCGSGHKGTGQQPTHGPGGCACSGRRRAQQQGSKRAGATAAATATGPHLNLVAAATAQAPEGVRDEEQGVHAAAPGGGGGGGEESGCR